MSRNKEVIRDLYAAFGRGDLDAALAQLADDVEWVVQGPRSLPFTTSTRGVDAVRTWLGDISRIIEVADLRTADFIADGDQVVVYGDASHRGRNSGLTEHSPFLHWYRIEDGKVAMCRTFIDTLSYLPIVKAESQLGVFLPGLPLRSSQDVSTSTRASFLQLSDTEGALPRGNTEDSRQLVRRWISYLAKGELDKALSLIDEQVQVYYPGEPTLPYSGLLPGREAVSLRIANPPDVLGLSEWRPHTMVAEDHQVVAFGDRMACHQKSGRCASFQWATVFLIQAGLIRRIIHFMDTLAQAEVLGIADQHSLLERSDEQAEARRQSTNYELH